jgi:hypothetical protein
MTARQWWLRLACGVMLAGLAGCGGGQIYPVRGQIQYREDGAPAKDLAGGTVEFQSDEAMKSARGGIDADGRFELSTERPGDGAVLGKHKVLIVPPEGDSPEARRKHLLDPKYSRYETSGLEATVEARTNELTLTVDRPPKR